MFVKLKKEDLEKAGIPFSPKTLYKWAITGKYPELFSKVGGRLLVDTKAFEKLADENRLSNKLKT